VVVFIRPCQREDIEYIIDQWIEYRRYSDGKSYESPQELLNQLYSSPILVIENGSILGFFCLEKRIDLVIDDNKFKAAYAEVRI
jgi:hypothetical protein